MHKFKVGDYIKYIDEEYDRATIEHGAVYKVRKLVNYNNNIPGVELVGKDSWWYEYRFELAGEYKVQQLLNRIDGIK